MKQRPKAGKEPVRLLDNRSQRSDQRSTHQRLPVAAEHHHGTRHRASPQHVAANGHPDPNNTKLVLFTTINTRLTSISRRQANLNGMSLGSSLRADSGTQCFPLP